MIIAIATFFALFNFCYIKLWKKHSDKVPTGIGVFLFVPCFFYFFQYNVSIFNVVFIFILSTLYFLDDLKGISFIWRIIFQIIASLIVFSFFSDGNIFLLLCNIITFVILVNVLNFQDGEDLNIALLLVIIFLVFYFFSKNETVQITSKIVLLFLLIFSCFNLKKNFLFFGDSGCFFVTIIIFLFAYTEMYNEKLIKYLISALAFPILDVFYVILYRFFNNQNLLTRNYLHIYQLLANKTGNKTYLLTNVIFFSINGLISYNFLLDLNLIIFLFLTNIVLLALVRLGIKKLLH